MLTIKSDGGLGDEAGNVSIVLEDSGLITESITVLNIIGCNFLLVAT